MFRYVALLWNCDSPAEAAATDEIKRKLLCGSTPWQAEYDCGGILAYSVGSRSETYQCLALSRYGLVFGALFEKGSAYSARLIRDEHIASISRTEGRVLLEKYWGDYVAVLCISDIHRDKLILRSPSGIIRCYLMRYRGVNIVCSNVEDVADLGLSFTTNWNYVAAELCSAATMGWEHTGLNEVSAVLPGRCMRLCPSSRASAVYWDPVSVAAEPIDDARQAIDRLRSGIAASVQAWVSRQRRALLMLSGGLDSAVILACIKEMSEKPPVTCLNLYNSDDAGDERAFARVAAESAGLELLERARPPHVDLSALLDLPKSARPSSNHTDHIMSHAVAMAFARELDATAVFSGQMGDELFCRQTGLYALIDHMWMEGWTARTLKIASDVSVYGGLPLSRVLFAGLRYGYLTRPNLLVRLRNPLLSADIPQPFVDSVKLRSLNYRFRYEWLTKRHEVPIGKLLQICAVSSAQAYFTEFGDALDPDWIMPLYTQPVIEIALRLPTHFHVANGLDRSIERSAFADSIPKQILMRRTKGSTASLREQILNANRTFVRELLLDGLLAKEGLLNREAVERALKKGPLNTPPLVQCIKTEAWLQVWAR